MRTTVDLPDDLARAVKIRAAERGETLKEVLVRAVEREVATAPRSSGSRVVLPLVAADVKPTVVVTSDDIAAALEADDDRYVA